MLSWSQQYLRHKPTLSVCTDWPELITDSRKIWTVQIIDSITSRLQREGCVNQLRRYVARVHDRKIDLEHEHCLYVQKPVHIDISDLVPWLDLEHTTYFDCNESFVLYRRNRTWQDQTIDFKSRPKLGVIFIDCWQVLATHRWVPPDFDFYQNMVQCLETFNVVDSVFHTGVYGGFPLCNQLAQWKQGRSFCLAQDLDDFVVRYVSKNIKTWIVMGAHWQRCTHDKPLGFHNLLTLKQQDPELRIYSLPECTAKFVSDTIDQPVASVLSALDYQQDNLRWQANKNLFELCL